MHPFNFVAPKSFVAVSLSFANFWASPDNQSVAYKSFVSISFSFTKFRASSENQSAAQKSFTNLLHKKKVAHEKVP